MYYNQSYRYGYGCGRWGGNRDSFMKGFRSVPANIEEREDSFELSLFAPGLSKEAIRVSAKDDVLIVSYHAPDRAGSSDDRKTFTRQEYSYGSFERTFLLNGKVVVEKISASYTGGILKVTLPKNPQTAKPAQDIKVG